MVILIVEDDPPSRRALRLLLEQMGEGPHTFLEAQSALHARQVIDNALAKHVDIHLAIIDWDLGQGLTGDYVAGYLRTSTAKFMLSGYTVEEIQAKWRDPLKGFMRVFSKPLDRATLLPEFERIERMIAVTQP